MKNAGEYNHIRYNMLSTTEKKLIDKVIEHICDKYPDEDFINIYVAVIGAVENKLINLHADLEYKEFLAQEEAEEEEKRRLEEEEDRKFREKNERAEKESDELLNRFIAEALSNDTDEE